jgi:hypothetical protein
MQTVRFYLEVVSKHKWSRTMKRIASYWQMIGVGVENYIMIQPHHGL